jgi:tetratricopeptide (TPR) repeat protein
VEALEGEICDPSERERALLIAADSIYRQREAPAVELFDRIIASGHDPVWLREAYLIKAQCLWNYHHGPEAVELLDELWALGPLEAGGGRLVGQGLLLQATILYPHRGNAELAEQVYEVVVCASDLFSAVQERAYLKYVEMLEQRKVEPDRVVALCDRGLTAMPDAHPHTWGMLSLSKAKAMYALGQVDDAIALAEQLRRENPNGDVKKFSREFVEEVGQ